MWQNKEFPEACNVLLSLWKTDGWYRPILPGLRCALAGGFCSGAAPRTIAGVCAGLALHYGWDLSLVRVIAVLALFVSCGTAMLAYFAMWIIIPDGPYELPEQSSAGNPGASV